MQLVAEVQPFQPALDLRPPTPARRRQRVTTRVGTRIRLRVREPFEDRIERGDPRVRLDDLEALRLEHACEGGRREVGQVVAPVERGGALVKHAAGEALDVWD